MLELGVGSRNSRRLSDAETEDLRRRIARPVFLWVWVFGCGTAICLWLAWIFRSLKILWFGAFLLAGTMFTLWRWIQIRQDLADGEVSVWTGPVSKSLGGEGDAPAYIAGGLKVDADIFDAELDDGEYAELEFLPRSQTLVSGRAARRRRTWSNPG